MKHEEKVIAALHSLMAGQGFLQGKGLAGRVAEKACLPFLDAKIALGRLARQGIVKGVSPQGEAFARVFIALAPPVMQTPLSLLRWHEAMIFCGLADGDILALSSCHDRLQGFCDADLRKLAQGLSALREAQAQLKGVPLFVVSAKYLLGSSKLLGGLPPGALRVFGIALDTFPGAVPQIIMAGPSDPQAVVLIENPHAFEEAVAAGCARKLALVVTFGYGLSRSGEAYGNNLSESVEKASRLVPLIRAGQPPSPGRLFLHPRIFFWGDLDREGLRIYASLRQRIPALRASALYAPMAKAAQQGLSHPYVKATAKDNQAMLGHLPEDVLCLVPLCTERGVDQELLSQAEIACLAPYSLEEKANKT